MRRQADRPRRAAPPAPADQTLGARLRAERQRRDLSLSELARRLGVTPSLISQIETGKAKPSVVTLYGIATELELSIDDLLFTGNGAPADPAPPAGEEQERGGPVQRAHRREVIELEPGVRWERLTASHDPDVDFLYCVFDAGGASSSNPAFLRHDGKEYGLVISGRVRVTIGADSYVLEAGDSVTFDAATPHRYDNDGSVPVHVVTCVVGK